jgi:hypothetical protein
LSNRDYHDNGAEKRRFTSKSQETSNAGKKVFLFTGKQLGLSYEYEHVNTGEIFTRPEMPSTNEEIQRIGAIWLSYKDDANARAAKMRHQTKLTEYFFK